MQITQLKEQHQISDELASIYHKTCDDNRWILMIDPEEQQINELVHKHNLTSHKLLRVSSQGKKLTLDKIEKALAKGHCAAIVLCNSEVTPESISSLMACAQHGKTRCIILNKSYDRLH
jgi:cell division inhibitor SulA